MIGSSLSTGQSPPLSVPSRFFITAPLFGVLASIVAFTGAADLNHRWTPTVLAVTHLLTLGYMGMVMLGALNQVFPVVIGHPMYRARQVSRLVHVCLSAGTLLLAAGFFMSPGLLMWPAAILLGFAVLAFLVSAAVTLAGVKVWGDTSRTLTLALSALLVVAGFGLWLALGHTPYFNLSRQWTDIHALWGLAGWVPLLLMGVAYQVVPMFQITPEYPRALRLGLPLILFVMLLASTVLHTWTAPGWPDWLPHAAGGMALAGFALTTLALQYRRRRKRPDTTVTYWRLGLVCLILAVATWTAGQMFPDLRSDNRFPVVLGFLMIPGFSLSVINGMLYRIIPFLVWLHLSMAPSAGDRPAAGKIPGMKRIISDQNARLQFRLHGLSLVLIGAGIIGTPGLLPAGAVVFALACGRLALDALSAIRLYHDLAGASDSDQAVISTSSEKNG